MEYDDLCLRLPSGLYKFGFILYHISKALTFGDDCEKMAQEKEIRMMLNRPALALLNSCIDIYASI